MKILKRTIFSFGLILIILLLAGCSSQLGASELINKAIKASEKLDSYQVEGKVELSIEADAENAMEFNPLQMFNQIRFDLDGVYQREPMQVELNMDVSLGQPGLSLELPIVLAENKVWLQVPALPIPIIPQESVGKYIEIDLQELQADPLLDESPIGLDSFDLETQQKLGMEILNIFTKHYDEDTYFSVLSADEAELSDKVEAEHLIRFTLEQDDVEEAVSVFINGVLPDVHTLLSEPEWSETLGISEENLEELKETIEEAKENKEESLAKFAEALRIQNIGVEFAINKDDHINYMKFDISLDVKDEESDSWTSVALLIESHLTNINGEQQFEHGIPAEEDTLSYEQLIPMFIGPSF